MDRLDGYGKPKQATLRQEQQGVIKIVAELFGGARSDDEGAQSPLIVFDSVCSSEADWTPEIRDVVAIQAETGLAEDHKKFDVEVLPTGTKFPIRFELLVANTEREKEQVSLLATALKGLEAGEVPIGARRSRGLGACHAQNWRVRRFALKTDDEWLAWLGSDHWAPFPDSDSSVNTIKQAIQSACPEIALQTQPDERNRIQLTAHLTLDGGLLVRSPGTGATDADVSHLSSGGKAVLPGTSLAGVLRTRAKRIAYSVRNGNNDADKWVDDLFGPRLEGMTDQNFQPRASRLKVSEMPITQSKRLRPNRIKIDRFTGGVIDGALFDEEPVYGGQVEVCMELRNPRKGEAGLLLLLLKDLLTGDLPVGGTSAVGRGVLKGTAKITIDTKEYSLDPDQKANSQVVQVLNQQVQEFEKAALRVEEKAQ